MQLDKLTEIILLLEKDFMLTDLDLLMNNPVDQLLDQLHQSENQDVQLMIYKDQQEHMMYIIIYKNTQNQDVNHMIVNNHLLSQLLMMLIQMILQLISKLMLINNHKAISMLKETTIFNQINFHISKIKLLMLMIMFNFTLFLDHLLELQEMLLNYNVKKMKLNTFH